MYGGSVKLRFWLQPQHVRRDLLETVLGGPEIELWCGQIVDQRLGDADDPQVHRFEITATGLAGFDADVRQGVVHVKLQPLVARRADGGVAYASLPLLAGDRLVGVLSIQSGSRPPRGRGA